MPCLDGKTSASIVVPATVKALWPNKKTKTRLPTTAAMTRKAVDLKPVEIIIAPHDEPFNHEFEGMILAGCAEKSRHKDLLRSRLSWRAKRSEEGRVRRGEREVKSEE